MKKIISTSEAPAPWGRIRMSAVGNLLFGGADSTRSRHRRILERTTAQTERVCQNIVGVLKVNDMTFTNVVKTTVFPD